MYHKGVDGKIRKMRGLIVKADKFYFKDKEKSTWPEGIKEYQGFEKEGKEFSDVINVWVCIEKDDKKSYVQKLSERIKDLNDTFYKLSDVVVLPFGHLSNRLADPETTLELINFLVDLLKQLNFKVDLATFGTHKDLKFEIPGQPAQMSYFEFPYSGKKPEVD